MRRWTDEGNRIEGKGRRRKKNSVEHNIFPNHDEYSLSILEMHAYKPHHAQIAITNARIVYGYV